MKYYKKLTTITFLTLSAIAIIASSQLKAIFIEDIGENNSSHVRSVVQDHNGYMWFGAISGLYRYDGYSTTQITPSDNPQRKYFLDSRIQAMSEWKGKYLWIRLRRRLYSCYDIQNDCFVDYTGNESLNDTYRSYVITNDSCLWLLDNENGCKRIKEQDGTFTSTKYNIENGNIPSNNVEFIENGANNSIWIGTSKGLLRMSQDKLQTTKGNEHFTTHVTVADKDYFVTRNGQVYASAANGKVTLLASAIQQNLAMPPVTASAASQNKIYITTEGPTFEYDIANKTLSQSREVLLNNGQLRRDNKGNRILYTQNGDIWYFGAQQPIHLTDVYNETLLQLNSDPHFEFVTDKNGKLWISTFGNGIYQYDTKTQTSRHIMATEGGNQLLRTNYLINIYEDRTGNIWACQEYTGVVCLSEELDEYDYRSFNTMGEADHSNVIKLLKRTDNNAIYIANLYNGLKKTDGNISKELPVQTINDDVVAVCADKQNHIWYGTRKSGVYIDGKNYQNIKGDSHSLGKGKISDIFCDTKGRVWISIFDGGLDYAILDNSGVYQFYHLFTKKGEIEQPRSMIQDHAGYIWLASSDGVYYFNPDEIIKDSTKYKHLDVADNQNATDEARCICEDKNYNVWVGTIGYGAALFDNRQPGKPSKVNNFTIQDGMSNNNINQIICDSKNRVWFGTDNGLSMYNPQSKVIHTYYPSSQTKGNMFTENAAISLNDGRIAFGTRQGILIINPNTIQIREPKFPLAITNIHINGVSYNEMSNSSIKGSLIGVSKIRLSHDQNSLTFFFSDFDYTANKNTNYTYKLEGVDEEWSQLSTLNFASYKDLKPGTYKMQVRARNSNGTWNKNDVTLEVCIASPWWATWWAYLIYIIGASLLSVVIYRQLKRVNNLRNQIKVENQLTEFKLRFFTNISHEFRTPLTIIRGAMDKISSINNTPSELKQPLYSMRKSTDRMLRLINQLIEFRKMQQDKLQLALEESDIIAFLRDIFVTFHEVAENKRINYLFLPFAREYKMYIDKNYLDKIVYNLLSNAFKYTPSKHNITLHVRRNEEDKQIQIIVEDTGVGVPKDKQEDLFKRFNRSNLSKDSIGIGLHLTHELVKVHHGDIEFKENEGGGSIFTVTIPDDKDVYQESDFLVADSEILAEENKKAEASSSIYKALQQTPMNDISVMVVEDDHNIQEFLLNELGQFFSITTANNGAEALDKIRQERPDLIISDVVMPIMSGTELTAKIRADKELADIPIILLTALSNEKDIIKGFGSGADAYVEKPFSTNILIARCVQLLEQRQRLLHSYAKEVVSNVAAPEIIIDEQDKRFQELLDTWLARHITDPSLNIDNFADSMGYGRTTFFKKVKKITGKTPNDYIRFIRMDKAAELLKDDKLTIAQVSYMVGINDPYYFSKIFKSHFGITPSNYRKGKKQ